jgi:hypothetical protein
VLDQLLRVGLAQNAIAGDLRGDDLGKDVSVGETSNKSVLGGTVLVLVLSDQLVSLAVVSLALSSSAKLDLVSLEVGLVLYYFNESLYRGRRRERGRYICQ